MKTIRTIILLLILFIFTTPKIDGWIYVKNDYSIIINNHIYKYKLIGNNRVYGFIEFAQLKEFLIKNNYKNI